MARSRSRHTFGRRAIGIGGVALLLGVLVPAGSAAAYNTRVSGTLVAGSDVQLVKSSFDVHTGNEGCGNAAPGWVSPSSQSAFCFQANGWIGAGAYDTELSFRYSIIATPGTGDFKGMLVNDRTHKCFDVSGGRTDDKNPLQMWPCNNGGPQHFDLDDNGPMRVLGRCVDAGGGDSGSPVTIRPCDGTSDQKWRLDGQRRLVNASNRCADVVGKSTDDGARMRLADCDSGSSQQWLGSSGYAADGHVLVPSAGTTQLSCSIERVNRDHPARHFSCDTSTVNDIKTSYDPQPRWTVKGTPLPPPDADRVIAVGDSVTAGFGYCGTEGGANSDRVSCGPNQEMANSWTLGDNALSVCQPPDPPVNDRCSNNNLKGAPWDAGPWVPDGNPPKIAYPFVIAKTQRGADQPTVEDWAMTGSTPTDWDGGGAFASQLDKIKNSYVVMTLGANPLLSYYLAIRLFDLPVSIGRCADDSVIAFKPDPRSPPTYYGAPLDSAQHGKYWGVLRCLDQEWAKLDQTRHLVGIYKSLLARKNRVVAVGYPAGCPWSFGVWQPQGNPFDGPAKGNPCTSQKYPLWDAAPGVQVSQWDQAKALVAAVNSKIEAAVAQAASESGKRDDIRFALPDQGAWVDHQAWKSSPWVFKNDTWIHPNAQGHEQLARTVTGAMCDAWRHWCGDPPSWK
jgi:hypothetical protein